MFKFLFLMFFISGCSTNNIDVYKNNKPEYNFEKFFNGKVVAYGSIFDFFGILDTRFIMRSEKIDNPNYSIDNKVLYQQSMDYLDTNKREEMISYAIFDKNNVQSLVYKDEMMVEPATYEIKGNAAHIKYDLKINAKNMIVQADDWSYMIDDKHIVNKIKIKKFGITVANVIMHIVKE